MMSTVNNLLNMAISESCNLIKDEVFIVRDLFKGYEWNRINRADRLLLGRLFYDYINYSNEHIVPIEKTPSGQQRYTIK